MKDFKRLLEISEILSREVITEHVLNKDQEILLNKKEIISLSESSEIIQAIIDDYSRKQNVYSKMDTIKGFNKEKAWKRVKNFIEADIREVKKKARLTLSLRYCAYVASAAIVLFFIILKGDLFFRRKLKDPQSHNLVIPKPGKSLIFTNNGKIVFLDNSSSAIDIKSVIKDSDVTSIEEYDYSMKKNSILVPYGTTCHIKMSDGTKIHFNSGSLLRFPSKFEGDTREVFLSGEAYFQVAHDSQKPFIVRTSKLSVKVLGTSFNISCYDDDKSAKVSLEEGSVNIIGLNGNNYATLLPNQQLSLDRGEEVSIGTVNIPMITSWKEGIFFFNNESIEKIARKLEKFYNIKIVIKDEEVKSLQYFAYFKRYQNPTEVFDILRMTKEIDYFVENNVLTVFSYNNR